MPVHRLVAVLTGTLVLTSSPSARAGAIDLPASSAGTAKPRIVTVVASTLRVHTAPSSHARAIATLVQQTQVEALSRREGWTHIRFWASASGWAPTAGLSSRRPWETKSTYRAPGLRLSIQTVPPQRIDASGAVVAATSARSRPDGVAVARYLPGQSVRVRAWQQTGNGQVWYETGNSWVPGWTVRMSRGPANGTGSAQWRLASGKGMWLTLGTMAESSPDAVARAAAGDGVTHLYVESAISPLGFHGRGVVGPMIEAAHRRHIAVIAWMFPYLHDLGADVRLTRLLAAYRTSTGQSFDGIAADLETNATPSTVRVYSDLVRWYLGSGFLLVGVTYPPQSQPDYPFVDVARDYDVTAPMDYWHETKTAFGPDYGGLRYGWEYGYRYAQDSIAGIHRVAPRARVAPIGQTFDDFGHLEMGPFAPSSDEVSGFLAGCRAGGAIGASFFQWMTVTDEEWRAIHDFRY
ncbi:MAG TPA: SH3 domain-containing protein [Chloroflexota bacterium]|nr:SH3 domain-containing protein [Chloroflexota bacterium]